MKKLLYLEDLGVVMDGGDAFIYLNDFYFQGDWGWYSDWVTRLFLGDRGYSVLVVKTYPSL